MNKTVAPLGAGLDNIGVKIDSRDYDKHLDRYVFCLEDLNLTDRRLSILGISKGRIARLTDISVADLDMSEEALTREGMAASSDSDTQMTTIYTKTAADQALELYINYGERGLVILNSLTGQNAQTVRAIEELLLAEVPFKLSELERSLSEIRLSVDRAGQLADKVRQELFACIQRTAHYRNDIVEKADGEMAARALPGGTGLNRITSGMRFYAESLDKTLAADTMAEIARKDREPLKIEIPPSTVDPNQIAQIVAATLAAMNQAKEAEPVKKTK